jgi:glutaredoxin
MTIYSRSTCGPCQSLKKYLVHKGVEFIEKSVDDEKNLKEMLKLTGVMIVPTVVKGDNVIIGLNFGALAKLL